MGKGSIVSLIFALFMLGCGLALAQSLATDPYYLNNQFSGKSWAEAFGFFAGFALFVGAALFLAVIRHQDKKSKKPKSG